MLSTTAKRTGIYYNNHSSPLKIVTSAVLLVLVFNVQFQNVEAARSITDGQVEELRNSVPGLRSGSTRNENLVRYLQASNGRISLAATKLKRTSDWRSEHSIDNIITSYTPSKLVTESLPYELTGTSNDGRPVVYIPLGLWNLRNIRREGKLGDVPMYTNQLLERAFRATEDSVNLRTGKSASNAIFIVDFRGFNLRSLVRNLGGNLFAYWRIRLLHDDHYPLLGQWYMIRAPAFLRFSRLFASRERRRNIHMYSRFSRRWQRVLNSMIPKNALPTQLGGTVNLNLKSTN